jgi:4-amino-4-deoxy-L-arabinose transferase-like glycosyltransferase
MPQLLAGVFLIPVLYHLVKRYFGAAAGLIAALALAVIPVAIATDRNNTMDSTLIFTLLLAAWAFIKATDTGKLKWLILGGVLVGMGFNIKMMQAFLPLPAFFALYFLGATVGWRRKIAHLTLTTGVLLVVSLSWAVTVDLVPASQRPYIGSSTNNSVLELIIGHNGLNRITGENPGGAPAASSTSANASANAGNNNNPVAPAIQFGQNPPPPPAGAFPPGQFPNGGPNVGPTGNGGGMFGNEIGTAGVFRLFTTPLANEISWLLPFGLFAVALVTVSSRLRLPLGTQHKGVVLWGGWLLTEVVFFSIAGFFHAYYLAMLAPPLAALIGMGVIRLWNLRERHPKLSTALMIFSAIGTVAFQAWVANQYVASAWWVIPAFALVGAGAIILLTRIATSRRAVKFAFASMVCGMMFVPAVWSGLTVSAANQSDPLPHAYSGNLQTDHNMPPMPANAQNAQNAPTANPGGPGQGADANLVTYLQSNTQNVRYMLAVARADDGAPYVLATGRPVLYIGGFLGTDKVIDVAGLQKLVQTGQLRYVLWNDMGGPGGPMGNAGSAATDGMDSSSISSWLQSSCKVVTDVSTGRGTLYQCD